jgi:hypothetical protein
MDANLRLPILETKIAEGLLYNMMLTKICGVATIQIPLVE